LEALALAGSVPGAIIDIISPRADVDLTVGAATTLALSLRAERPD